MAGPKRRNAARKAFEKNVADFLKRMSRRIDKRLRILGEQLKDTAEQMRARTKKNKNMTSKFADQTRVNLGIMEKYLKAGVEDLRTTKTSIDAFIKKNKVTKLKKIVPKIPTEINAKPVEAVVKPVNKPVNNKRKPQKPGNSSTSEQSKHLNHTIAPKKTSKLQTTPVVKSPVLRIPPITSGTNSVYTKQASVRNLLNGIGDPNARKLATRSVDLANKYLPKANAQIKRDENKLTKYNNEFQKQSKRVENVSATLSKGLDNISGSFSDKEIKELIEKNTPKSTLRPKKGR